MTWKTIGTISGLSLQLISFVNFFFGGEGMIACGILVRRQGIEPILHALENLHHWATREVSPRFVILN